MSHKISARRRAAFLDALQATGNQTLAAERAKVSRSWVQLHRSGDPEFDAEVRAAVAEAKASFDRLRMSGEGGRKPPSGWGFLDGEELVVKGTNGRRVQIARARLKQWTPRIEERFLATLGATCNVKAACAEVGMTAASAYAHRKRWPAFARRWDEAIELGYMRLEDALLQNAENLFSRDGPPPEAPLPGMTVEHVIHILHMHKHQVHGIGRAPGVRWRPPPTLEEVRPGILRKFEIFMRGRALPEADKAKCARDYARRRELGQSP